MKLALSTRYLALAGATLVLAGCTKKPQRPDPSVTAIGLTPGGSGISSAITPPTDASFNTVPPDMVARGSGFDASNQDRGPLRGQTVYFEFNQSTIRAGERAKLKTAKEYLDKNPGYRLLLEGHCDWRGTAEYNLSLGDRRASAVKSYLQSIGVAADKLDTLSKGSLEASKNADNAAMEKDRRVDLVVVNAAGATQRVL